MNETQREEVLAEHFGEHPVVGDEITVLREGVPGRYTMPATELRDWLSDLIRAHEATNFLPAATVDIGEGGLWCNLTKRTIPTSG